MCRNVGARVSDSVQETEGGKLLGKCKEIGKFRVQIGKAFTIVEKYLSNDAR